MSHNFPFEFADKTKAKGEIPPRSARGEAIRDGTCSNITPAMPYL